MEIGDVEEKPSDLKAPSIDHRAGLPKFAEHRQFLKAWVITQHVFDLYRLFLQYVQIRAENFYRKSTLQTGQRFVDRVFRRLGVIKDDTGERFEIFLQILG